jgi:hypothetical protein
MICFLFLYPNFGLHSGHETNIYLFFSTFSSRSTSLLASIKVCVFVYIVCVITQEIHFTCISQKAMCLIQLHSHPDSWTFLVAYSKAKLKSIGDKSSPCFTPFWIAKLSDKCLRIRILLYVLFKHVLSSPTDFIGIPNTMGVLYNTSLLTEF